MKHTINTLMGISVITTFLSSIAVAQEIPHTLKPSPTKSTFDSITPAAKQTRYIVAFKNAAMASTIIQKKRINELIHIQ